MEFWQEGSGPVTKIIAFIGLAMVALTLSMIVYFIASNIKKKISYLIVKYKIKRRFNKKNLKCNCFCVECEHWMPRDSDLTNGYCDYHGIYTSDGFACIKAISMAYKNYLQRKGHLEKENS